MWRRGRGDEVLSRGFTRICAGFPQPVDTPVMRREQRSKLVHDVVDLALADLLRRGFGVGDLDRKSVV